MLLNLDLKSSKEYEDFFIADFKKRVLPVSLVASALLFVAAMINFLSSANVVFAMIDLFAALLFAGLWFGVKQSKLSPWMISGLFLGVFMVLFIVTILLGGSVHGMLFNYTVVPFIAFYIAGVRVGRAYCALMLAVLAMLWLLSSQGLFETSYNQTELSFFLISLCFAMIAAWYFEYIREKTFQNSYLVSLNHHILLQEIDEVYYRVDMKGIIEEIGDGITKFTDFIPKEVVGETITAFYAIPEERDAYVQELLAHKKVTNYPITVVGKNKQHVHISMNARIVFNTKDKPEYIEGMFRDITKETLIERERQQHLDHLTDLGLIEDALSQQDFELSIHSALKEMLDIFAADRAFLAPISFKRRTEQDVEGDEAFFLEAKNLFLSFDVDAFVNEPEMLTYLSSVPAGRNQLLKPIDALEMTSLPMAEKYQVKTHLMVLLKAQSGADWLLSLHQCGLEHEYTEQHKRLFVDISRRIRGTLNQLILHKDLADTVDRVEVASKAKSEFLATMSHELRTPLHGVIGLLDLLGVDINQFSQEQQKNLKLAQTSAHVLSSLIDDVLDLAKIESGKVELHQQTFMLQEALCDALIPFVMKSREKGLDLTLEMNNVATQIQGDVIRLRQVLLNLVGNAVKFTAHGYIRIVVSQSHDVLQINIEVSGIGIDADKQDAVFKPFSQVHDVSVLGDNLQEKGTGLGTTIAKHFVEMMGGKLTLQSASNVGSTMCIRLPLQQVGVDKTSVHIHIDDMTKGSHMVDDEHAKKPVEMNKQVWSILLAEDDPVGRRVASKRLQRAGFKVEAVADGELAWQRIQEKEFDLLLTDVRMPGLDGMQLTKNVRQLEKEQEKEAMLIVGLSAYALEEVKAEALLSGMDEFVSKPIDMSVLIAKLEESCDKKTC